MKKLGPIRGSRKNMKFGLKFDGKWRSGSSKITKKKTVGFYRFIMIYTFFEKFEKVPKHDAKMAPKMSLKATFWSSEGRFLRFWEAFEDTDFE